MNRRTLPIALCLLVGACVDADDLAACLPDAMPTVVIDVDPHAFDTLPVSQSVTFTGTVDSDVRIERLLVGETDADGTRDNFATWTATRTVEQLQGFRAAGGLALVPVVAIDVCGAEHMGDPSAPLTIPVRVDAAPNSDAPGLAVEVVPATLIPATDAPECYLPADGSGTARVRVFAEDDAVGVGVAVDAAIEGQFLGAADDRIVLEYAEGARCPDTVGSPCARFDDVFFRPTEAGYLGISVAAGRTFGLDSTSGLRAFGPPSFSGASGAIARGQTASVRVRTGGRLASCVASSSQVERVTVSSGSRTLLAGGIDFDDDPQCGQEATFDVTFDAMASIGLTVDIECEDSYGQTDRVSLSAGE